MNRAFCRTVYMCRRPQCKHKYFIASWIYDDGSEEYYKVDVGKTPEFPWNKVCRCGCQSFDLIYKKVLYEQLNSPQPFDNGWRERVVVEDRKC